MSIFVDASKRFQISINFDEVKTENGDLICYKFSESGSNTVVCDVKARNFADMSHIIEEATIINAVTGNPMVRTYILCKLIILSFFKSWNLKDSETGNLIPINNDNIGKTRHEIVRALAQEWLKLTSGK